MVVDDPVRDATGALTFAWQPVVSADEYRLILYGSDLVEHTQVPASLEDRLSWAPGTQDPGETEAAPAFWRIRAYRQGDPIAESALRALPTTP